MDLDVNFIDGGSFIKLKPQFSLDNSTLYTARKNVLIGYNIKTGKQISELTGFSDGIIGFFVHSYDSFECISASSKSGEFITWKTVTRFKVFNQTIGPKNIKTFQFNSWSNEGLKVLISYPSKKGITFATYDVEHKHLMNYRLILSKHDEYHVDISPNGYFAVAQDNKIHLINASNDINTTKITGRTFTCLTCHPTRDILLTGDNSGRIVLWNKIWTKTPTQNVFHWHTLSVETITFSPIASTFYSGGNECVLVRWQCDNHLEKKFLPRLTATIKHISITSDNQFIAVATDDNGIKIIDNNFNDCSLIQQLVVGKQYHSGIHIDPRTKALIMNGSIGQIQFYLPQKNHLLYKLDVIDINKITNERNCQMENTEIIKIAINKSGDWMVTVERRQDREHLNELRMKFWNFDAKKQIFTLNTSIEDPHDDNINAIEFQPIYNNENLKCITVGNDCKFKIWQLIDATTIYKKGVQWQCFGIGYYRNLPCDAIALSIDGSLMAIGFDQIITTWLPDTCELKCSLIHSYMKEPITHLKFGKNNTCHLIVSASSDHLNVWSLLTLCLVWSVPLKITNLIADSITTLMAVVTVDHEVYVFTPDSSEPIYASGESLKKHQIITATFLPTKTVNNVNLPWYKRSQIYFIDQNNELYSIGDVKDEMDTIEEYDENVQSLYGKLMPKMNVGVNMIEKTKHSFRSSSNKSIENYMNTPIHTMMPIRFTCSGLLESMVLLKS